MIISAWVFSRWMALIYLAAFWSLAVQILGLIGGHGILPVGDFLHYVSQESPHRFWSAPTLCWLNGSDGFLLFLCWGGVVLSILLLIGIAPALISFLLWLFYLSLTIAGQDFLGFQWDNLLLEAGLLLIFLVPYPFKVHLKPTVRPSIVIIWLLRWLLFRLMFESGMVKLLSGDPNWSHLTALTYHYWTQPLPNMISWYMNQLPLCFQQLSCAFLFAIELIFPFFIFCGRWGRLMAFAGITTLQVLIILTGNYCFFNLLAIGLCLTLLEDEHLVFLSALGSASSNNIILQGGTFYKMLTTIVAAIIFMISLGLMANSIARVHVPKPLEQLMVAVSPLRSINNYGLFAVMTTGRDEIIIEGSNDGQTWLPYEFRYKPGDVNQAPKWAMPHQPRLDWQMWFASLGTWRDNPWLLALMSKLLQGEPSVEHLLAGNPFADHPPRYIQATLWEYHFTDFKTRGAHGPWWRREVKGAYCPIVSLRQ
jgi:hypothetical protein